MEDLLGVEHFDRGAAHAACSTNCEGRGLDATGAAPARGAAVPCGALGARADRCKVGPPPPARAQPRRIPPRASRDPGRVAAKLNAWPGLLPLLLKAVRLTLAATKVARASQGSCGRHSPLQGGPAGAAEAMVIFTAQVVIERMQEGVQTSLSKTRAVLARPSGYPEVQ